MSRHHFIFILISLIFASALAQQKEVLMTENFFKAPGSPVNPKVEISWNRYYTNQGLYDIYQRMETAYPDLITVESIGKSYEDRDIWMLTITNLNNKPHKEKPGFYIDGNIHANEIQAAEVSVYTAWYLLENYNKNPFITHLLNEKVFYIAPVTNPDGREHYMEEPNTVNTPRSGTLPVDDDGDGKIDEDGFDDLNGDGHITQMRRRNPMGQWKEDPEDNRRMIRVEPGEFGEWELLGNESVDNDEDGEITDDRTGYYDPNRDWGWNWQPDYVQSGAYRYPFSLPETRAVRDFVINHPNIAGAQSYHNTGGMLLRGPGAEEDAKYYLRPDVRVYDALGELGDELIPGYRYMTLYKDLYVVYGGQIDWFHMMRGVFTFTNELFTSYLLFHNQPDGWFGSQKEAYKFDKHMLFEDAFVPWQDFDHPQFGEIQIGGFKKNFGRINPGFMLEQDAHRNMAFTLYHAYHTPHLEITDLSSEDIGGGMREITAVIANKRLIPTHAGIDIRFNIERPNYISLEGGKVLAGMIVKDKDFNINEEQKVNPSILEVENIPGMESVTVKWIVEGGQKFTVKVDSAKGGIVSQEL
ncbi:MAG: M14 family metallopeptidase [Bacteroidales bacterium]